MNMRVCQLLFGIGLAVLPVACVAQAGDSDGSGGGTAVDIERGEHIAALAQELNSCLTPKVEWNQAWYPSGFALRLQPSGTHVCALHRVQGNFRGDGESLRVYIDPNDGYWYLQGTSHQQGVDGTASCVRRSCFSGDAPNENWLSGESRVETFYPKTGCISRAVDMWWGDAATLITGFSGRFDGRGEKIQIFQSPNPNTPSQLIGITCGGDAIAYGYSFFVGAPGGINPVKLWTNSSGQTESTVDSVDGPWQLDLARTDQAFCYFSEVGGKFRGDGEWASLNAVQSGGGEVWRLAAGGLTTWVERPYARARCVMYDQHH